MQRLSSSSARPIDRLHVSRCAFRSDVGSPRFLTRAQLGDTPPPQDASQLVQTVSRSRQTSARALTIGPEARIVEAFPAPASFSSPDAAVDSGSPADAGLLRGLTYAANAGILASTCLAAASGTGVLDSAHALQTASSSLHATYCGLLSTHPIVLKVGGTIRRSAGACWKHLLRTSRLIRSQPSPCTARLWGCLQMCTHVAGSAHAAQSGAFGSNAATQETCRVASSKPRNRRF